jgi:hypothetical protein
MDQFKACVRRYLDADNLCKAANKNVRELGESRRIVEVEMVEMINGSSDLSKLNKVELADNSYIKIDKPGWNKSWSLSKKDLREHLDSFFSTNRNIGAESIYDFVVTEQSKKLVSTDFAINRLLRE